MGGRPKTDEKKIQQAVAMYDANDIPIKDILETTNISRSTLYSYLKERKKSIYMYQNCYISENDVIRHGGTSNDVSGGMLAYHFTEVEPLSAPAAMKTPREYKKAVENNVITPRIAGDDIYTINKRAKNMRNQEMRYRNQNRCFGFSDRYGTVEKYREKKEQFYEKKGKLLKMFAPTCIHVTEEKAFATVSEDFDGYSGTLLLGAGFFGNAFTALFRCTLFP